MVAKLAVVPVVVAVACMSGCIVVASGRSYQPSRAELNSVTQVHPGDNAPSVRSRRTADLAKVTPGMSESELRSIFNDAVFVETRTIEGQTWTAYSVTHTERFRFVNTDQILTANDELWLYFENGRLVRTGAPETWRDGKKE